MGDPRIENITELLRKQRELAGKLYEILAPEIMSYEIVDADLRRKRDEMKELEQGKQIALMEIEEAKKMANSIKEVANEKAAEIIDSGKKVINDRLMKIDKLIKDVEQFVSETDRNRYNKLITEKSKMEKIA